MCLSRKGAILGRAIEPVASKGSSGMGSVLGRTVDARENAYATLEHLLELEFNDSLHWQYFQALTGYNSSTTQYDISNVLINLHKPEH